MTAKPYPVQRHVPVTFNMEVLPPPPPRGFNHGNGNSDHFNNYLAIMIIFLLYCMAMRGMPEYIAQARTILHASVGQVQYGPSAGNIFWYPPNIKPCKTIIIIHKTGILCRHHKFVSITVACGSILLSIDTVSKMKMHPVLV